MASRPNFAPGVSPLLEMPSELIDTILSYLSPSDLTNIARTCRAICHHALADLQWQRLVQQNVPGIRVATPSPCKTFHKLYAAFERLWFLPKYKIWFGDRTLTGKMILVRYDQRRGCIEGYELLANNKRNTYGSWSADDQVVIHEFEPKVGLHLDKPILQFKVGDQDNDGGFSARPGANRYSDEMPMVMDERLHHMYSNFLLTKPLDHRTADLRLAAPYPYAQVWPTPAVPARHHVSSISAGQDIHNLTSTDRPRRRSQVSDQAFRIRHWMELLGTPLPPGLNLSLTGGLASASYSLVPSRPGGVHIGEEVTTYSTLDPSLYTPTKTRPFRGIWVGDYSGHGCEFLLVNQPDDPPATDEELDLVRLPSETNDDWEQRRLESRIYRGRLEGIKLTGDPNVPRGEYAFVVDNMGPDGFVCTASDPPFNGSRVVRSMGHIAETGFVTGETAADLQRRGTSVTNILVDPDKFVESQLILVSPNRLAHYWVGFGHISYFERANIDDFLDPGSHP